MKRILFALAFVLSFASYGQKIWTGSTDNNWNVAGNWSPAGVPTATDDVVIPNASAVNVNAAASISTLTVQGNASLTLNATVTLNGNASFSPASTLTWNSSGFAGTSTITMAGTVNLAGASAKSINGALVLNNTGTINHGGSGSLFMINGTLNNSGLIDLQGTGMLTYSGGTTHVLANTGTLRKTADSGTIDIDLDLINSGLVSVQAGTLRFSSAGTQLNGGTYDVSSGATLTNNTTMALSGTLTGNLVGTFAIASNFSVAGSATLNFSGPSPLQWQAGTLSGGGTLNNQSSLSWTGSSNKLLNGIGTLNNSGNMTLAGPGSVYIINGILHNLPDGSIDLQSDGTSFTFSGGSQHLLINEGLIKKTTTSGLSSIDVELQNSGTLRVETGNLQLNNATISLSGGQYDVFAGAQLSTTSAVTMSGTLTGTLDGPFNIGNNMIVAGATTATLDFTGTEAFHWTAGILSGGGMLSNSSVMFIDGAANKQLNSTPNPTLRNQGTIRFQGSGALFLTNGNLINESGATFHIENDASITFSGGTVRNFTNHGLLQKTVATGTSTISVALTNDGTISINTGTLRLDNAATVLNGGIYNVSTGATFYWANIVSPTGTLTGTNNGTFNWAGTVSIPASSAATFNFSGGNPVDWISGSLLGGGTLNMQSPLRLSGGNVIVNTDSVLNNSALIQVNSGANFYVIDGIVNNLASATMDLQGSATLTYTGGASHVLNNFGLIKKTGPDTAINFLDLHNSGTLQVEQGTFQLSNSFTTLDGGIYNTFSGAALALNNTIGLSGTLTGTQDGEFNWLGDFSVAAATTASINFTGANPAFWKSGSLTGGGTLALQSPMNLTTSNKNIVLNSTLANSSQLSLSGGHLYVVNGTVNNLSSGTFTLNDSDVTYTGGSVHVVNNHGLLVKSATGSAVVYGTLNNFGTVRTDGALSVPDIFANTSSGIVSGTGSIVLPATNFTNDGTFAPGGNPGTLTVTGNYKSSATSHIAVDLNGLAAGSGYDVMAISGTGIMAGSVAVNLGFVPAINDSFIIATTGGTISSCNLENEATAVFGGLLTTFSVGCQDNNKVVVTVIEIVAAPPGAEPQTFCQGATVADLAADGQNIQWYADATGGSPLAASTVLSTGSYYATQTISGFESERVAVAVTVNFTPEPTAASPQNFMSAATVADLSATGTDVQWYDSISGGSALASSAALSSGNYYVTQTLSGCESSRKLVVVNVTSTFPFYADADGDSFGAGPLVFVAADGPDAPPEGYSLDNSDCDDADATVWQSALLYVDADGDGYDAGTQTVCYGNSVPEGYAMETLGSDCDDTNASVFQGYDYFVDADGDGFGSAVTELVCAADPGVAPEGYSLDNTDCDDADATAWQSAGLYIDADGDGYDAGTQTVCYGDSVPAGYAMETLGSDCDDTNAAVFQGYDYFVDADGDGFGSAVTELVCAADPGVAPEGYSLDSSDCDDADANIHTSFAFFVDADDDGFGSGTSQMVCAIDANSAPSGYALADGDCNDANAAINPAATEIPGNGIDENCNGMADDVTSGGGNQTTAILASTCGTTLTSISSLIGAVSVPNATAYQFKVVDNSSLAEQTIMRSVPNFSLTQLASYDYSASYSVSVKLQISGVWQDIFGPACNIMTPLLTGSTGAAQIVASQCGITLPTISTLIATNSVAGVSGYRFRITNMTDATAPNQVQTIDRTLHWFALTMLDNFTYGTTYMVEVAMKTNGSFGDYGNPCTVTTPAIPTLLQCGMGISSASAYMQTQSLNRVSMYRFELTNQNSGTITFVDRSLHYFNFNQLDEFEPGAVYSVRVALQTSGIWSVFGNACTITAPGASRSIKDEAQQPKLDFRVVVYPNPYVESFALDLDSDSDENIRISVYDLLGKRIDQRSFAAAELEFQQFGERYPSGVYNIVLTQGTTVKNLRVIKR